MAKMNGWRGCSPSPLSLLYIGFIALCALLIVSCYRVRQVSNELAETRKELRQLTALTGASFLTVSGWGNKLETRVVMLEASRGLPRTF
jgi:hypothetical protein